MEYLKSGCDSNEEVIRKPGRPRVLKKHVDRKQCEGNKIRSCGMQLGKEEENYEKETHIDLERL